MNIKMQQGAESKKRLELLYKLTKFSDETKQALTYHFDKGANIELAANVFNLKAPNLIRSINRLQEVNNTVESIKQIDFEVLYNLA
tara:strand:+ start:181 stop:438 length:258 start_codon:yes stop_codon:yes gene_type:complete